METAFQLLSTSFDPTLFQSIPNIFNTDVTYSVLASVMTNLQDIGRNGQLHKSQPEYFGHFKF